VGVLALLVLGAVGLSWQERVVVDDDRIPAHVLLALLGVALGVGLVFVVVALILARGQGLPGPAPKRTRRSVLIAQGILLLAAVFLLSRYRDRLGRPDTDDPGATPPPVASPIPTAVGTPPGTRSPGLEPAWSWPVTIVAGVVLGLVVLAAVWVFRKAALASEPTSDLTADEVRRVVAAGRAALAEIDAPRAAVIRAYAAMERALQDVGVERRLADTPTDLLHRAQAAGLLGDEGSSAARELSQLFQRARFSRRPLPPDARWQASAALERLEAELRRTTGPDTGPSGTPPRGWVTRGDGLGPSWRRPRSARGRSGG
jgi:hypothetical protein